MRTKIRSKLSLLFIAVAAMIAFPAVAALADDIVNNIDPTVDATAENIQLAPSGTRTVGFYVNTTDGDGKNGCNFQGSETLDVSVSSDKPSVASVSPSSLQFGSCGDIKNVLVTAGSSTGTATITVSQVRNTTNDTFNFQPATFTVTVAQANQSPNQPGTISTDSSVDKDGAFKLSWSAASPVDADSGDTVTYTLEHKDTNDTDWSTVKSGLTATEYSFGGTSGNAAEAEGTWDYRVKAVDNKSASSTYSVSPDLVKVDKTKPTATANFSPADPVANSGGWYNAPVTVSYSTSTDPALADGSAGSGVASYTPDQTFSNSGTHSYSGRATDAAGNSSDVAAGSVKVDRTNPVTTATAKTSDNASYASGTWTNKDVTVDLAATDAHSGTEEITYEINGGTTQTYSSTNKPTVNTDGVKTITFRATDKVGNKEEDKTFTVNFDKTAPGVNCGSASTSWLGTDASIACTASDSGSGLASGSPASFNLSTNVDEGTETDNASTGTQTLYDVAGNESTAGPISGNKVDKKAPGVTDNGTVGSPDGSSNWYITAARNSFKASDGGSGLANNVTSPFTFTKDSGTQEGSAVKVASGEVKDAVGNATPGINSTTSFKVDLTNPQANCGSASANWLGTDASIACTASDSGSGLASGSPASFNLSTNVDEGTETDNASTGTQTLYDNAGRSVTAGPISGNKVDKKAPGSQCGNAPTAWSKDDASIACTASEGGSGLSTAQSTLTPANFNLSTSVAEGTETSNASTGSRDLYDAVGNKSTAGPISGNKVDKKAPSVSYEGQTASSTNYNVAGLNGWYIKPVQVEFSTSDGGSGLASGVTSPFTRDSGTQEGQAVKVASGEVKDAVGNATPGINSTASFNIDLSGPSTPTFSGIEAKTYAVADLPAQSAISCSATDANSGFDSCSISGYSSGFGKQTLTATAYDKAGNSKTNTLTYTVGLQSGEVLSPVNSTGKANPAATNLDSFKIKSTVPVKFKLYEDAAKTKLLQSPPAGSVAKLTFFKQDNTTDTSDLSETLSGTANTDNIFRWSGSPDYNFVYNLGTSGRQAGTYGVQLTLTDSSGTQLAQSAKYYFVLRS